MDRTYPLFPATLTVVTLLAACSPARESGNIIVATEERGPYLALTDTVERTDDGASVPAPAHHSIEIDEVRGTLADKKSFQLVGRIVMSSDHELIGKVDAIDENQKTGDRAALINVESDQRPKLTQVRVPLSQMRLTSDGELRAMVTMDGLDAANAGRDPSSDS